jgi:hypothetical protein
MRLPLLKTLALSTLCSVLVVAVALAQLDKPLPKPIERPFEGAKSLGAAAQSELEALGMGNPFWVHPRGDGQNNPCTHTTAQHPAGDPIMGPCTHLKPLHPEGDDTGAKTPCQHLDKFGKPMHGPHPVMLPCPHIAPEHPAGHDTGKKTPCVHLAPAHPHGHPGPWIPCVHKMPLLATDPAGTNFYTDHPQLRAETRRATAWLKQLGIDLNVSTPRGDVPAPPAPKVPTPGLRPRPLSLFTRPPVFGNSDDNKDPMWSHYNPVYHSVQVLPTGRKDPVLTLRHELGHALVGRACHQVIIASKGGAHSMTDASDAGLAMSEGWAHFVCLTLTHGRGDAKAIYEGRDFEAANDKVIPLTQKSEFRVACVLWDLYDTNEDGDDRVSVDFAELFRVFSPSLATLPNGPVMRDLDDYLDRLTKNHPALAGRIKAVRDMNTGGK